MENHVKKLVICYSLERNTAFIAETILLAVFEDLYGNLWDLLQLNNDYPISKHLV